MPLPTLLFPEAVDGGIDLAFEKEANAARDAGFQTAVLDGVLLRVPKGPALYRGWMLTPDEYTKLHEALKLRQIELLTDPTAYRLTHYLPETYPYLVGSTPESMWFPAVALASERPRIETALSSMFGRSPLVIKDYVKSEKAYWDEAMFIPDASNAAAVWRVVDRFLELRGEYLNVGVVFRRFVELSPTSGPRRPLTSSEREVRIFWLDGAPVFSQPEGPGVYYCEKRFRSLARSIPARFFTMDAALVHDTFGGQWTIIECGDGQVSSVAPGNERAFYDALRSAFSRKEDVAGR